MSQIIKKRPQIGYNVKSSETRVKFLEAFEKSYGKISASCLYAGISRRTYYRWMASLSGVNVRFRKQVLAIRPVERQLDLAEARLMEKVDAGDMRAIELVLKTRGRSRGYGEQITAESSAHRDKQLEVAANAFQKFVDQYKHASVQDKITWLRWAADGSEVDFHELADRVGFRSFLDKQSGTLESIVGTSDRNTDEDTYDV